MRVFRCACSFCVKPRGQGDNLAREAEFARLDKLQREKKALLDRKDSFSSQRTEDLQEWQARNDGEGFASAAARRAAQKQGGARGGYAPGGGMGPLGHGRHDDPARLTSLFEHGAGEEKSIAALAQRAEKSAMLAERQREAALELVGHVAKSVFFGNCFFLCRRPSDGDASVCRGGG